MDTQLSDSSKPMPVTTDISRRAIRERNPEEPPILPSENGTVDEDVPERFRGRTGSPKKEGYRKYSSALRKTDNQSALVKRKQKYADAIEGAKELDAEFDDFYKSTGINPEEPDIMSTVPVGKIKEQYLSSASEEGKVIPASEERPTPHQLQPQWPPPEDMTDAPKPQVIQIQGMEEKPKRTGVDAGHVESMDKLKNRWQSLPEKYRDKPMGVNKPHIEIKGDKRWITQFRPVIDEGQSPEDPEWLKMVRHRRWMSTVKARFPEDEVEKVSFERRSTTPRKFKKPNPYTIMRSTHDLDNEFDDVMRRRRKRSDSAEEENYLTKSGSSFVKSASSFVKSASSFHSADSESIDRRPIGLTSRNTIKGPIKEYLKNLSLERSRTSMLKWSFPADVVDEPYRFDLPKPLDLLVMDELERENEWRFEQAKRKFASDEDGMESIQSLSHASFTSEDDIHENGQKLIEETAGFIPKLTDTQQKLQDEVDYKPVPKSVSLEEDTRVLPKFDDVKDKYLAPENDPVVSDVSKKKPFKYEEDEKFEGVRDVKKKLPMEKTAAPQDFIMPTTAMKGDKDFKQMMQDRKKQTDENLDDRAESAAQEIKSLASDISRTYASDDAKEKQAKPTAKDRVESQEQPQEPKKKLPEEKKAAKDDGTTKSIIKSLDEPDSAKKKDQSAKSKKEEKHKSLTFEDEIPAMDESSSSNLKSFADHRRKLRPARKHAHTSNPIKARQQREDLRTETDILVFGSQRNQVTEVEDLEKSIPVPKKRKDSNFTAEAIEGLSKKENLAKASTSLRKTNKNVEGVSTETKEFGGFLPVMLLQIKGHRHMQTRLVEPSVKSLNSGDAFVLVTHNSVYVWIGKRATIMKKAKATEVSTIIVKQKDLGTSAKTSHLIVEGSEENGSVSFWKHLGGKGEIARARDFPKDEEYEKNIQATNIVYRVDYSRDPPELREREDLSGRVLSEKFMDPDHAYVLDFGTEVYLWLGRNCNKAARIKGMKLTQDVFDGKFKYKSRINPLEPRTLANEAESHVVSRPSWALLGRMTARSETVLFRQKFIDWPDHNVDYTKDFVKKPVSGSFAILTNKKTGSDEEIEDTSETDSYPIKSIFNLKSVDVNKMIEPAPEPSLVLENFNIGRGIFSVDEEGRKFTVVTVDVKVWHVKEYTYNPLDEEDYGHFHSCEGYVVRWKYCVKRAGVKTLKGKASRIEDVGRDKLVFFFWQGKDSTINEKGAAALMTVELDSERGPHVLVAQGKEPPCFPRLFGGKMVVHLGKREPLEDEDDEEDTCMFIVRNEEPDEAFLLQVKTDPYALRSRTSFVVVDLIELILYVWHGAKSGDSTRTIGVNGGKRLLKWFNEKYPEDALDFDEVEEGVEPELFWDALRGDQAHVSLVQDPRKYDFTTRVFSLSSLSGEFAAKELLNPSRSLSMTSPYPVFQEQLYSGAQPAIFLIDAVYELYMWQGWWPRDTEERNIQASTTGSAETRFSNDRRLAMETTKSYAHAQGRDLSKTYIVFAGLELKSFKALFPFWMDREDVKDINMLARKDKPVLLKLEEELNRLSRATYSLAELQKKPLPEGVDPTRLEMYLHVAEFEKLFGMSKKDYEKIPTWKRLNMKKKANLF